MREINNKNIIFLINYICLIFPVITVNIGYYDATRIIVCIFLGFSIYKKIIKKKFIETSLLSIFICSLYNPIFSLYKYDPAIWTLACIIGSAIIIVFELRNK